MSVAQIRYALSRPKTLKPSQTPKLHAEGCKALSDRLGIMKSCRMILGCTVCCHVAGEKVGQEGERIGAGKAAVVGGMGGGKGGGGGGGVGGGEGGGGGGEGVCSAAAHSDLTCRASCSLAK